MSENENALIRLEEVSKEVSVVRTMANSFKKSFALANAIQIMRSALTDEVIKKIMQLQGNPLGFKTDKDKSGGYPLNTVRDVAIYAAINDAYMCGNEVNIIAGNPYLTKEYYSRKVNELQDESTEVFFEYGDFVVKGQSAIMPVKITIRKSGCKEIKHSMNVTVPCHAGFTGPDAILGKVEKRAKKWAYERLTGHITQGGDVDDPNIIEGTVVKDNDSNPINGTFKFPEIKPILDANPELFRIIKDLKYRRGQIEELWSKHNGDLFKIQADLQDAADAEATA